VHLNSVAGDGERFLFHIGQRHITEGGYTSASHYGTNFDTVRWITKACTGDDSCEELVRKIPPRSARLYQITCLVNGHHPFPLHTY
jgi:hypothetical protein